MIKTYVHSRFYNPFVPIFLNCKMSCFISEVINVFYTKPIRWRMSFDWHVSLLNMTYYTIMAYVKSLYDKLLHRGKVILLEVCRFAFSLRSVLCVFGFALYRFDELNTLKLNFDRVISLITIPLLFIKYLTYILKLNTCYIIL